MALWLELIPKLHKSDHLDARYHQLDDWDNLTSFEAEGTRHTARGDLLTTTRSPRPASTSVSTSVVTTSTSTTTASTTTSATTGAGAVLGVQLAASSVSTLVGQQQTGDDDPLSADVNTVSLSITIAVGSFLLFVNILVFVAVYYQKDRIRRERRRHKADLRAHQLRRHDELDGIVARADSVSSDIRSQLSLPYGYTDLVDCPPAHRSNHVHQHTLPPPRLTSPPAVIDAPAYGTVRSRAVPRWSATSDQVDLTTTKQTYSECAGHNGGLAHKCAALSSTAAPALGFNLSLIHI